MEIKAAYNKYGMELGDRCYPDKKFEEFCGIKGRDEIVSLGWMLAVAKYSKEIFAYVQMEDHGFLGQLTEEWRESAQLVREITIEEAIDGVNKIKNEIKESQQLLYYELYSGVDMNGNIERFPSFRDFKFCGYEIMNGSISLITNCGDINIKHVGKLNQYGLFSKIEDAIYAQEEIAKEDLDEDATGTLIYGIWRYINEYQK